MLISDITNKNLRLFYNLNYLVIDCLREASHYSHYNLYDILNLIKDIKPKKTILTNLDNSMDYESLKRKLPNNIVPAYDGMSFYL